MEYNKLTAARAAQLDKAARLLHELALRYDGIELWFMPLVHRIGPLTFVFPKDADDPPTALTQKIAELILETPAFEGHEYFITYSRGVDPAKELLVLAIGRSLTH